MRKATLFIFLLIACLFTIISCSKGGNGDDPVDCSTVAKTWSANVSPIIQTFCNQQTCHDVASVNGPGPLTNYSQVFNARSDIRIQISTGLMPQNATLTAAQRNAIICWIDSGAPNN